jgi:hypothetical protein
MLVIRDRAGYENIFKKFQKSVQSIKGISLESEKDLISSFLLVLEEKGCH